MSSKRKEKIIPTRKKSVLPLKIKIDILDRLRLGESFASISRCFNVNESTVRFIKKSENKIRNSSSSTSLTTKIVRDPAIERMEAALSLWIEDRNQRNVPLNGRLIRDKAMRLYTDFKEPCVERSRGEFRASAGWLNKFKLRQSLDIKIGETASSNNVTDKYPEEFPSLIADGEYKPEQLFNADIATLFWRIPNKTLPKSEKSSGFKAANKIALLLCSNASGDCVVKPHKLDLNSRVLKQKLKDERPVVWRANKKAWVTGDIFCNWFYNCFVPEVESYFKKSNLNFKAALVLDNASHSRELDTVHPNIKVVFLPPNATSLQPMDQGIQAFKHYYIRRTFKIILDTMECYPDLDVMQCCKNYDIAKCIGNVKESLEELKPDTLKSWKKLWPMLTVGDDEGYMQIQNLTVDIFEVTNRVGNGIEEVDSNDTQELLDPQNDLTENNLEKMLTPHCTVEETPASSDNLNLKDLSEGLRMANELCDYFIKIDPSMERSLTFKKQISTATFEYQSQFNDLLKVTKQKKITKFFKPSPKLGNKD